MPRQLFHYATVTFVLAALAAQEIRITQVASGINLPADIQSANDGSDRLFVLEQCWGSRFPRVSRTGSGSTWTTRT